MPFIVFEGGEGSGKTTQYHLCLATLERLGKEVCHAREPGGTSVGEDIRRVFKGAGAIPPLSELFLLLASRAALLEARIRPALAMGRFVLLDRYVLSTMAYQVAGRGLPEDATNRALDLATGGLAPDAQFVFMVDPAVGHARTASRARTMDRFELEREDFHRRVSDAYKRYGKETGCFFIDTNTRTPEDIHAEVMAHLRNRFPAEFSS